VDYHNPVMLDQCIEALNIKSGGIYIDVTFGGGGHSKAILEKLGEGRLIAFDQDKDAIANAPIDKRFTLIHDNFRNLKFRLNEIGINAIDGLLADLGVSSHQFDEASRGFSIRFNASLDMRMDQREKLTARDILNGYPEHELIRVFREYGELTNSRNVAALIAKARREKFIETIDELKEIVGKAIPKAKETTFLAQLFQALRIEVNDEMGALKDLLVQSAELLKPGGRLVVMSYHSLEDRPVKNIINTGNINGDLEKDLFGNNVGLLLKPLHKKPIEASEDEVKRNPRSRSAKLRIAEKL
jgi:16S rRNA (cytosine1402-N4)-methyltransferase